MSSVLLNPVTFGLCFPTILRNTPTLNQPYDIVMTTSMIQMLTLTNECMNNNNNNTNNTNNNNNSHVNSYILQNFQLLNHLKWSNP
jgi:hypothetical protein